MRLDLTLRLTSPAVLGRGGVTVDEVAPSVSSLSPIDDATDVAINANLIITFDEDVQFGSTVSIALFEEDDTLVESWDENDIDSGISISGAVLTINPASDLDNSQAYYVQITAGSIEDLAGNAFAGIEDETAWSFTTVAFEELYDRTLGTAFGNSAGFGGVAAAFDGTTNSVSTSCAGQNTEAIGTVGKTFATPQKIRRVVVYGSNNLGFGDNCTLRLTATISGVETTLAELSITNQADESGGRELVSTDQVSLCIDRKLEVELASAGLTLCAEIETYVAP